MKSKFLESKFCNITDLSPFPGSMLKSERLKKQQHGDQSLKEDVEREVVDKRGIAILKNIGFLSSHIQTLLNQQSMSSLRLTIDSLEELYKLDLLTPNNKQILIKNAPHAYALTSGMIELWSIGLLDEDNNLELLVQCAPHAHKLAYGIKTLYKIKLLTQRNKTFLIKNAQYADVFSEGLYILLATKLLNQKYEALLCKYVGHAHVLAEGIYQLQKIKLLNQIYEALLCTHAQHADILAKGICTLHAQGLLNKAHEALLCTHAQHADVVAIGMCTLFKIGLLNPSYITLLCKYVNHADDLAAGIKELVQIEPPIQYTIGLLTADPYNAREMALLIKKFYKAKILSSENLAFLIQNVSKAYRLAGEMYELYEMGVLNEENKQFLKKHLLYCQSYFVSGLRILHRAGLLTQDIPRLLGKNPDYISCCIQIIKKLHELNCLTTKNIAFLSEQDPENLKSYIDGFFHLSQMRYLTQENTNHFLPHILAIMDGKNLLYKAGLQTPKNEQLLVKDLTCLKQLNLWMNQLYEAKILNQKNFYALLHHQELLETKNLHPFSLMNQETFDEFIRNLGHTPRLLNTFLNECSRG